MESELEPYLQKDKNEQVINCLKCLLADEYILLNKTSFCLLDSSSPFTTQEAPVFQQLIEEVRINIEATNKLLQKKLHKLSLSIDDIITNTQLVKQVNYSSKVAAIEYFLDDHLKIIQSIEKVINTYTKILEEEDFSELLKMKHNHKLACMKLNKLLKELFNYKSVKLNKNLF